MLKGLILEEFKKWVVKTGFLFAVGFLVIVFTPYWDNVKAVWNNPATVSRKLESMSDTQVRIEEKVDQNTATIDSLLGNDRVIRQPPGLSYVREPVLVGEDITIFYVIQRTEFGHSCNIRGSQALFKDGVERVLIPGTNNTAPRNGSADPEEFLVTITPPPNLNPGRIEVYLVLEYECDYKTVFDKTEVLAYKLLEN